MTINRNHWNPPFVDLPSWLCPTCQSGSLALNKETLKILESGPSEKCHDHEAWEPEWIDERFVGLLSCQDAGCGEIVAIGGRTNTFEDIDWERQEREWVRSFTPTSMYPAPPVFRIPEKCPKAVAAELRRAFSLFWTDTGSCANRLRAAVEALLTDRKVPRSTINKKGRERLSLHARIEKFKQTDANSADYLLAIKWLGNAGSHANLDELGGDDLLNGFELFQHVVDTIYVQREKHLKKIAQRINSRKGRPIRQKSDFLFT
jgi:Domain of unknown function (DUF4145)